MTFQAVLVVPSWRLSFLFLLTCFEFVCLFAFAFQTMLQRIKGPTIQCPSSKTVLNSTWVILAYKMLPCNRMIAFRSLKLWNIIVSYRSEIVILYLLWNYSSFSISVVDSFIIVMKFRDSQYMLFSAPSYIDYVSIFGYIGIDSFVLCISDRWYQLVIVF